jgi:hypothetical protein
MNSVMTVPCQSCSSQEFDGCPACVDAALDAVTQAGIYILGQAAPTLTSQVPRAEPLAMDYLLKVSLLDEEERQIGSDEIEVEQAISVEEDGEWDDRGTEPAVDEDAGESGDSGDEVRESMRLDDFQTVIDAVDLAPAGASGANGAIRGRIFGFERSIGRFEIEVCRSR